MEVVTELATLTTTLQKKLNEAMASLTRQSVDLSIKDSGVLTTTEVHKWLNAPESAFTAIYVPIIGEVTGDIFVFLPEQSAYNIADLMIGNPLGTTTMVTEFEGSALKEMGNITTGVIVTEIADALKLSMMLTTPNLATDMVGALVDQVLIEYGEISDKLLGLQFPFNIKPQNTEITGSFVLFFDSASFDIINKKIKGATS
jgi:chemotaxis protein CheY-P-specific phosphatase CheC